MLTEASEIGEELGDVELHTEALAWLVASYVSLCDHDAAHRALDRLFDAARRMSQPFHLHVAEHYASAFALCDGDLAGAEAAAERSREWSQLLTGRDASGVYGIQMFGIRREREARGAGARDSRARRRRARRRLAPGPRRGAGRAGDGGRGASRARAPHAGRARRPPLVSLARVGRLPRRRVCRCSATSVRPRSSTRSSSRTRRRTSRSVISWPATAPPTATSARSRPLGEWERAERHFEAALELNRRLGVRTWLAHTCFEYARMLAASGRRVEAAPLLGEALTLATQIGLPTLTARVAALGGSVDPVAETPDGLTAREVEILRLVARGLSNREIGGELHISEHTAANHIRSILRKTGCANRTEAAAYAHRRSLVTA